MTLAGDPVFRDGAFTSNDSRVRAYALQKTMRAIDLGVEFGAKVTLSWETSGHQLNASEIDTASQWLLEHELIQVGERRKHLGIDPVSATGSPYDRAAASGLMGLCFSGGRAGPGLEGFT